MKINYYSISSQNAKKYYLLEKENDNQDYLESLKLKKKINLTGKDCYIAQLAQITGVSLNIGRAKEK